VGLAGFLDAQSKPRVGQEDGTVRIEEIVIKFDAIY